MGLGDRARMTLGRKVVYAIAVVVVLLVASYLFGLLPVGWFPLGNEPPIRVKNGGSIEMDVSTGNQWKENDDDASWSPDKGTHPDRFSVKVTGEGATAGCGAGLTATGKMVDVSYSGGGGVLFRSPKKTMKKHTRVTSFGGDLAADGQYLRYDKGGAGYISAIVVRGGGSSWKCTFDQKYDQLEIYICSSSDAKECK